MKSPNGQLIIGEGKAAFASIYFEGMSGPKDCNGTFTIPASSGFKKELLNGPAFVDGGAHTYRITTVWDIEQDGEDIAIRFYGEAVG